MKTFATALLALATTACVLVGPPRGGASDGEKAGHDAVICHKGKKTMTLPQSAVGAHLDHGDRHGPC